MNDNALVEQVLQKFDFERVHKAMKALKWTYWYTNGETPTTYDLIKTGRKLLYDVLDRKSDSIATGGFEARAKWNKDKTKIISLELNFIVAWWSVNNE